MIRRKMWAAATCALAVAGAARAQTAPAPKATLGLPRADGPNYVARGAAPNPGYPSFVPRNYTAPNPPTYAGAQLPTTSVQPTFGAAQDPPAGPMPAIPMPKAAPMNGTPMSPSAPATLGPPPTVVENGSGGFAADQVPATPPPATTTIMAGPVTSGPVTTGSFGGESFFDGLVGYTEGPLPMAWASLECLNWKFSGVSVPPLVTTAPAGSAGTLDDAATRILYGGNEIADQSGNGYRVRAGMWFDTGVAGVDFGFFGLSDVRETFAARSTGDPGLYRPFYNTAINAEDAQLVAFIDPVLGPILSGAVGVSYDSELWGMDLNYRSGLTSDWGGRFDLLCGYKYLRLRDTLGIRSDLTVLGAAGAAPAGTTVFTADRFEAVTQFHGAQVGAVGEWNIGCMTFGVRGTVAAGVSCQRVEVSGVSGSTTPDGTTVAAAGGLFALPSNIGTHDRNRLAFAHELGLTTGYQVTNNIRVFGAYNFLYWTQVVRAGEQINRFVNGTAIPDPTTGLSAPVGAPSPLFRFRDDSFFAHGWSLGVEFRW